MQKVYFCFIIYKIIYALFKKNKNNNKNNEKNQIKNNNVKMNREIMEINTSLTLNITTLLYNVTYFFIILYNVTYDVYTSDVQKIFFYYT